MTGNSQRAGQGLRRLLSPRLAWLMVCLLVLAGAGGIYLERQAVAQYYGTRAAATPHVIVLSSDDWGGLPPSETLEDVASLADTLRQCRDSLGRPAVLTAYMVPFEPDTQAMAREDGARYICRPAYQPDGQLPMLWKQLVNEGVAEIGFHGRDHWDAPLYLHLLRTQEGFREAAKRGGIPYRGDPVYDGLLAADPRLKYLQRSYIDASTDPPKALGLDLQRQMTAQGLQEIHRQIGVRPVIAVAPGHVWDTVTCEALQGEGLLYLETVPMPVRTPDAAGQLQPTGEHASYFSKPGGIDVVVRTDGYEPAWKKVPSSVGDHLWGLRQSLACGVPAVVSLHKASFAGPDERAKAQARQDLQALLAMAKAEFPDVVYLSAADLGHYMHGRGDQARRSVEFSRLDLSPTQRVIVTIKALWLCHAKLRGFVFLLGGAVLWALAVTILPRRRNKLDVPAAVA